MKKLKLSHIMLLFSISILFACGSAGGNQDEGTEADSTKSNADMENNKEDYSAMREVDLSEHGVMATIQLPDENKGKLEINKTDWGSVEIRVGDKFGMEIVPFGMSIDEKMDELKQGSVYQVETLEMRDNYMLYKKFIPNSEVLEEHHFFLNTEIEGEQYEVKSLAEMELKEAQARNILKSAKSLTAKKPA